MGNEVDIAKALEKEQELLTLLARAEAWHDEHNGARLPVEYVRGIECELDDVRAFLDNVL